MEANKKKPEVVTLPSGLRYKIIKSGSGAKKTASTDEVSVYYKGTLVKGKIFGSSAKRGMPK